jgi:hypothetical protein
VGRARRESTPGIRGFCGHTAAFLVAICADEPLPDSFPTVASKRLYRKPCDENSLLADRDHGRAVVAADGRAGITPLTHAAPTITIGAWLLSLANRLVGVAQHEKE